MKIATRAAIAFLLFLAGMASEYAMSSHDEALAMDAAITAQEAADGWQVLADQWQKRAVAANDDLQRCVALKTSWRTVPNTGVVLPYDLETGKWKKVKP